MSAKLKILSIQYLKLMNEQITKRNNV